ncbi:MAG: CehA/McbA family metallohydrolase [Anaerolineae bacterium]|nr:CehA/McbA family metallohydrolase [Anaerolineae bacterium]
MLYQIEKRAESMQHIIQGTLTTADAKQHIPHTFNLPPGATRLDIAFDYEPKAVETAPYTHLLCFTLFDPQAARGTRHNNRDQSLTITDTFATPGYIPGPLPSGEWQIVIDTHRILPGDPIAYTFTINVGFEPQPAHVLPQPSAPNGRGRGWYRGDLHGHTLHSDGSWDVPNLVAAAQRVGLDFATLTDHNTVSGLAQMHNLANESVLTMGGMELTTYYGHALALGVREWIDWRVRANERDMNAIAREVEARGGLFVIAHPKSQGDPVCTGCDWRYTETMPGVARCVEIWNKGAWYEQNEQALALWYAWLNAGYRMVATAGTDIHGQIPEGIRVGFNNVFADALQERAILDAVRRGHLYLSSGPRLELTARNSAGDEAMMGDAIDDSGVEITCTWKDIDAPPQLRLIADGSVYDTLAIDAPGTQVWSIPPSQYHWIVAEIRDETNELRAVTNPVFLTPKA